MRRSTIQKLKQLVPWIAAGVVCLAALAWLVWPDPGPDPFPTVFGVAHTDSEVGNERWPAEVERATVKVVESAYADGVTELTVLAVGSSAADAFTVADIDLALDCPSERRCAQDVESIGAQIASLSVELARTPASASGSDLVAGLAAAADECGTAPRCRVVLLTDGQDSRLADERHVDELAAAEVSTVGSLAGVEVFVIGVGADGAPPDAIERATTFWHELVTRAGGPAPTITRNP